MFILLQNAVFNLIYQENTKFKRDGFLKSGILWLQ